MVQVIEQLGNIGGRIGKGFAQGLSEQLPDEIKRQRLSAGIEKLKSEGGNLTPFEQAAQLYSLPGATPDMINTLIPLLQQQNARREATGQPAQPGVQPPVTNAQPTAQGALPGEPTPIPPRQDFRRLGTPEAIKARGSEITQTMPFQYPTQAAGEAYAKEEYETQQRQIQTIDSGFDKVLENKLQKGGKETYSDVLGDLQEKFRVKAQDAVLSGQLTPQEAITHYTKEALDFAKNKNKLDQLSGTSFLSTTPTESRRNLDVIRKGFEKADSLEEFKDMLIAKQNMSEPYANSLAFPVGNNPELTKYLDSIEPTLFPKSKTTINRKKAESPEQIARNIGKHLSGTDSLSSIALHLRNKAYDSEAFLNSVRQGWKDGKIQLNQRQVRELSTPPNPRPKLGDIYLFTMAGKDPLGESK